ncbi:Rv3654c family TadE-like protein [Streptomyces sp. NPDC098090]|uniref:Rv3654c family TadE-like protein n=1 Tax=Streptomyces sp. NPDC098090 TaxID=3366095 RepID=UPI00380BBEA3
MTGTRRKRRTAALARLRAIRGPAGGDRGLATVWVAMTTATLCAVFAVVLALGQVVAVRHRAGGAADLAALAAADRALQGPGAACGAAEQVATAQGAVVVRCAVRGEVADVTARVSLGPYEPVVRSRAGPPGAAPGPFGPVPPARPPDPGPPVPRPPAARPSPPRPPTPSADSPGRVSRGPEARTAEVR